MVTRDDDIAVYLIPEHVVRDRLSGYFPVGDFQDIARSSNYIKRRIYHSYVKVRNP